MAERETIIVVGAEAAGERLDKLLAGQLAEVSRTEIQALIRAGQVTLDGQAVKASLRLAGGETIAIRLPEKAVEQEPQPEAIALAVLYEDDAVAVIDKPAGMVVHPAFGHTSGTLVNAVLARWPQIAQFSEPGRAGIVHRLDKETSGVIVLAKTAAALEHLRAQFKARAVTKRYLALVEGLLAAPEGVIEAPIGRDPQQRKRMAVVREGRAALTHFRVVQAYHEHSLLEVFPKTGRTHQVRVHLAFIGHPVVGDTVYGPRKQRLKLNRHFLHAATIRFEHPVTGEPITVSAPLPVPLQELLDRLAH